MLPAEDCSTPTPIVETQVVRYHKASSEENLLATERLACENLSDVSSDDFEVGESFAEHSGTSVDPVCPTTVSNPDENLDECDAIFLFSGDKIEFCED